MKVLGIIPARGGSKRVPRKNIAELGGKPLLKWTLEAAQRSGIFDELWVSTEDREIGEVAGKHWFMRDPSLARDDTPSLPVVMEVFNDMPVDVVILLQPTSPFRTADDINAAFDLFKRQAAMSVISVTDGPSDLAFELGHGGRLRSVPKIVVPNGAIYILHRMVLEEKLSWYEGPQVYAYHMPKERSLDIDNGVDLELARYMVTNGYNRTGPTNKALLAKA